jgi:hypothetical protein
MNFLRNWLFLRSHHHSCNRTIASARELSLHGHAKRRQSVKDVARQIREELGLPPDRRLV